VPYVTDLREAYPSLGKKAACDHVADSAVEAELILEAKRDTFANSLLQAYKRYLYVPSGHENHGNSKLSEADEDLLLGIIEGSKRGKNAVGKAEIIDIASILFPDRTFGLKW
jgi:hypothetical protein